MWKNSSRVRVAPGEELHVVEEDHVRAAKALLEAGRALHAHGLDELARELLDGRVAHPQAGSEALDVVADRVQQVRLADPRRAVQEERVVGVAGQLRHRQRRRVSEAVSGADHELVEGVLRVQAVGLCVASRAHPAARRPSRDPSPGRQRPAAASRRRPPPRSRGSSKRAGRGPAQERQVALGDRGADVLRRAHVDGASPDGGELERLEPDVELEVGSLPAEFVADVVPDLVGLCWHRRSRPSCGAWSNDCSQGKGRAVKTSPRRPRRGECTPAPIAPSRASGGGSAKREKSVAAPRGVRCRQELHRRTSVDLVPWLAYP